jgi:hypothetical protein
VEYLYPKKLNVGMLNIGLKGGKSLNNKMCCSAILLFIDIQILKTNIKKTKWNMEMLYETANEYCVVLS